MNVVDKIVLGTIFGQSDQPKMADARFYMYAHISFHTGSIISSEILTEDGGISFIDPLATVFHSCVKMSCINFKSL